MNLFQLPDKMPREELFEELIPDRDILIERIISVGHTSPENFWYEQERDEMVVLLQGLAIITWETGRNLEMKAGDWVLIPARQRHRVAYTSSCPPCIWLAVHGKLT